MFFFSGLGTSFGIANSPAKHILRYYYLFDRSCSVTVGTVSGVVVLETPEFMFLSDEK